MMMNRGILLRLVLVGVVIGTVCKFAGSGDAQVTTPSSAPANVCDIKFPLPNASDLGSVKFEKLLYAFLEKGCYSGWVKDRETRNSGPFIGGASFGTHNAVRIFYSPQVWDWVKVHHREGDLPDGSMIVKEMFPDPAKNGSKLSGWTVM